MEQKVGFAGSGRHGPTRRWARETRLLFRHGPASCPPTPHNHNHRHLCPPALPAAPPPNPPPSHAQSRRQPGRSKPPKKWGHSLWTCACLEKKRAKGKKGEVKLPPPPPRFWRARHRRKSNSFPQNPTQHQPTNPLIICSFYSSFNGQKRGRNQTHPPPHYCYSTHTHVSPPS